MHSPESGLPILGSDSKLMLTKSSCGKLPKLREDETLSMVDAINGARDVCLNSVAAHVLPCSVYELLATGLVIYFDCRVVRLLSSLLRKLLHELFAA